MFLLPNDYWEVRETPNKGRGVFAKKDISAGTVIGDYLGKIIHDDDDYELQEEYGFYSLSYTDDTSIWPDPEKPGIYLINHSCTPNTYILSYYGHTIYFALRKIFKGEELTVSYLMSPADADCDPCEHDCHCGSMLCTSTMHMTQASFDAWNKFDDEMLKKYPFQPTPIGGELQKLSEYPKIVADYPVHPLYGALDHEPLNLDDTKLPAINDLRKIIRSTGQKLFFKKLKKYVLGIADQKIIERNE
jgi:hypothetical protein